MTKATLSLTREAILAARRRASALDERLPWGARSLRTAAWAGLQDSMPRAALLSIHGRVTGTPPTALDDPELVQIWGPRFSAYVVGKDDVAPFTLGRLPDAGAGRRLAEDTADRLEAFLAGRTMTYSEAGHGLGVNPNALRYAAPTGRFLIRWEGARAPMIWAIPRPTIDAFEARLELARRYLHVLGPGTAAGFATWAGIKPPRGVAAFGALADELVPVTTPLGDEWILATDEAAFRSGAGAQPAPVRLLPSGDTWYLLQGRDRELLVPDRARRAELWTSRVWPGALLLRGEVAGVWRRAQADLTVSTWRTLSATERAAIEAEAAALPLPGLTRQIRVAFD